MYIKLIDTSQFFNTLYIEFTMTMACSHINVKDIIHLNSKHMRIFETLEILVKWKVVLSVFCVCRYVLLCYATGTDCE